MLEVNVNRLVTDLDPAEISGSIAERGANAAAETWENAKAGALPPLLTADQHDSARHWLGEFGAWSDEEIAAYTAQELDALVLQYAAGDLRELQAICPGEGCADIDWTEVTCSGNLFVYTTPAGANELWISLE